MPPRMGQFRPVSRLALSGAVSLVARRRRNNAAKSSAMTSKKMAAPNPNMSHHSSARRAAAGPWGFSAEGVWGGLIGISEQAPIDRNTKNKVRQRYMHLIMNISSLIDYL